MPGEGIWSLATIQPMRCSWLYNPWKIIHTAICIYLAKFSEKKKPGVGMECTTSSKHWYTIYRVQEISSEPLHVYRILLSWHIGLAVLLQRHFMNYMPTYQDISNSCNLTWMETPMQAGQGLLKGNSLSVKTELISLACLTDKTFPCFCWIFNFFKIWIPFIIIYSRYQ